MKKLVYILPLLCTLNCAGQHGAKEDLLNEVYLHFVDSTFRYYYLCSKAVGIFTLTKRNYDDRKDKVKEALNHILPVQIADDIFNQSSIDTLAEKWDSSRLEIAKCFDDNYDTHINDGRLPLVQQLQYLSRQFEKYEKTARNAQNGIHDEHLEVNYNQMSEAYYKKKLAILKQLERLPLEEHVKYMFSKPVYDRSGKYAMIRFDSFSTQETFLSSLYLFKKTDDKWIKISIVDSWGYQIDY